MIEGRFVVKAIEVIEGMWYEQLWIPWSQTYHLLKNSWVALVYSHLITTSKVWMPLTIHVLKGNLKHMNFLKKVLRMIEEALEAFKLLDGD